MARTIKIHERERRGPTDIGWLKSQHTFSFGGFMDPNRMGFRSLRVVNDDTVAPGGGFGTHPHNDMEIISVVLEGALEHKDSMGNGSVIRPGEIQKMSAGTGITHSEFNHSQDEPVHFYQIWIVPDVNGIEPSYEQITLDPGLFKNGFRTVGDRQASADTISIQQDAKMLMAMPREGDEVHYEFADGRNGFLQVVRGQVVLNGQTLREADGAEISDINTIAITAEADSEMILFDMG